MRRPVPARCAPALCATALLALALAPASAAVAAEDPAGVSVTPTGAAPGDEVRLSATGCDGRTGAARSDAFVADGSLTTDSGNKGGPLTGRATIRSTVTPGSYDISVTCDGTDGKVRGSVTVTERKPSPTPSPTAPVRAGGGGTADLAADTGQGFGTRHAVLGGILAAAAALAVTGRLLRRRR